MNVPYLTFPPDFDQNDEDAYNSRPSPTEEDALKYFSEQGCDGSPCAWSTGPGKIIAYRAAITTDEDKALRAGFTHEYYECLGMYQEQPELERLFLLGRKLRGFAIKTGLTPPIKLRWFHKEHETVKRLS